MTGGSSYLPGSLKTVREHRTPPVNPQNPNSRRGRKARGSAISSPIVPSILRIVRFLSGGRLPTRSILIVVCTMDEVRHGLSCTTRVRAAAVRDDQAPDIALVVCGNATKRSLIRWNWDFCKPCCAPALARSLWGTKSRSIAQLQPAAPVRSAVATYSGSHPFDASSNPANSNPGATVQPTNVQSPSVWAACQA